MYFIMTVGNDFLVGGLGVKVKPERSLPVPGIFKHPRKIAKSDYPLRHVCPSVPPHAINPLPLQGFLWNFTFKYFSNTR